MTLRSTSQAVEDLRDEVTRLASDLVAFETSPELALLRDASGFRGRSAETARAAVAAATDLWAKYPDLQAQMEALGAALRRSNVNAAAPLLQQARASYEALASEFASVRKTAHELSERWNLVLPRIESYRAEMLGLDALATELDLADDADLAAARHMIAHLSETVTEDPLGTDPLPAERALERARTKLRKFEHMKHHLATDVEAARRQLDELARLIVEGADALENSRVKVDGEAEFLEPLPPHTLDTGDHALRPWLDRIATLAARGQWRPAGTGLERWRVVADGLLANARAVVDANSAPTRRRDELRGLLESYRSKAAARGWAEDAKLTAAAAAARDALYEAPCDLDRCAALVAEYGAAVNKTIAESS